MPTLAENLRTARKSRRMGQVELARLSGVSQATISGVETGVREPHASTLRKLGDVLGLSVADLYAGTDGAGEPPRPPRTPLTDERPEAFDERFAGAADAASAEMLQDEIGAEFDAIKEYIAQLKEAGVEGDDFRLKRARARFAEAKRRTFAATARATDLALREEFGRDDRPIFGTVAEYVGAALEADAEEAQKTPAPRAG